jgi:tetratricopeptide (TPR) repeat protein
MSGFRKVQLAIAAAAALWLAPGPPGFAQSQDPDQAARLDELFAELAQPKREDWERIEGEITRIWSSSGSPAMDLLLSRGNEALKAEDYGAALEHFSALIDHAPDFAEGWNGRATTYYLMGEFSLSIADVEHVLVLNPRHFGALAGLAFMFEQMEEPELALQALTAVQKLNPNRPNINDAVTRLERMTGDAEL